MLRVQSFEISNSDGINALLENYRLAKGAHILVSDGKVCIPYEDGQPATADQQIAAIGEEKNELLGQLRIIEHSQKVVDLQIADAEDRANSADAAFTKTPNDKRLEQVQKETNQALKEAQNLKITNNFEIIRIKRNIELYDEEITALK